VVRLPVKSTTKAGVQNAAKPVRAPSHPPQRTSPEAGGSRPPVTNRKSGEGAIKKLPANKEHPISTRTRRATSVPAEKCEATARRERVSPHPPRHIENYISLLSSDEEGTQFQPSGVGRLTLKRKKATGPPPKTTSNEGVVTRSRRSTSAPVEKSAVDARLLALDRPSSRATGNPTSPIAGGPINIMDQWRTPPAMLPSLPPTTRGSPAGSPGEILISISPATSLPTTLTTCTVTTTTCGSPITSTGFTDGVGRQLTPPACLPQRNVLPTIGEERTSPCVAVTTPPMGGFRTSPLIQPGPSTPAPERGLEERRQEGAASRTPIWTVSVGRKAKRRQQLHDRSPSNSESPPTAGPSCSPRIAPLCALIAASTSKHDESLSVNKTHNNICQDKTPPRNVLPVGAERRRRETSPEDRAGGDVGHGAGTRPERGLEERRQEGAASRTPITEGDNQWGGQWTVSVGRRAKRRQQLHDRSPSNSESPPTAGPSRSPRIAPLCALIAASTNLHENSLNLSRMDNNNCLEKTPPRNVLPVGAERRRRETSPEDRAGGDVGHGAGTR
ncbi:PREDICTED: uncharacterized protein DKFZp434B061-like, partial [Trachymyrmex cornetzi]|uniref:uncharacterized protein DKFZp434B061-like n=1 Tax=Trachymyrmex cornetzi TaxID=471704 RepID=UPI00084EE2A7